jgi:hypothetical protein
MTAGCAGGSGDGSAPSNSGTSSPTATIRSPGTSAAPAASTPGRATSIRPGAGDVLAVVGVAHDDVLNVRTGPGTSFPVLTTVPPLAADVTATGQGWLVDGSAWFEVSRSGVTGWANGRFLAWRDGTADVTSQVVARVGRVPGAETMVDLGREVAGAMAPGPGPSTVVMSEPAVVGDLGEVTYDVVGLGDDSLWALRLHVVGQPADSGAGLALKSVEATSFCGRGPARDGRCP